MVTRRNSTSLLMRCGQNPRLSSHIAKRQHRTNHICLPALFRFCHSNIVQDKTLAFASSPRQSGLRKESRCVSKLTLTHCAHQTLRGFAVTEHIHRSQAMSPCTSTKSLNRRDVMMRNGQVPPIPLGGHVSGNTMISSLPELPSIPSDQFYDTVEITNPTTMQVESASKGEPSADAFYGPGGYENIILRWNLKT